MPIEVTMPRLSDTMEQGTVVSWNVKEGDAVNAGDILGDIETDKATMELQNFDDGTVAAILVEPGQSIEVGKPIILLAEEGEDPAEVKSGFSAGGSSSKQKSEGGQDESSSKSSSTATVDSEEESEADAPSKNGRASTNGAADRDNGERIFASPLARKIAEEKGVDLAAIEGTGPGGRIVRKDVEEALSGSKSRRKAEKSDASSDRKAPVPPPPMDGEGLETRTVELSNMRRTIARRLAESKSDLPHYYMTVDIHMDELLNLRKKLNEQLASQGVKLTVNDFIVRACAIAMHQHPFVNSRWIDKDGKASIELEGDVNIGVAIALNRPEGGLVVATIRNADRLGLRQISAETKRLAEKARAKGLTLEEMADSTFTISNLGMYAVEHYTAIINPPNAAILAVGAATPKPVVRNGQIAVGHLMSVTMSSDHRLVDGAMVAQYLQTLKGLLEAPATLLV